MMKRKIRRRPFPELSYASPSQHAVQRWFIRTVEGLSGRDRFAALYDHWRTDIVPSGDRVFARMLDLIDVRVRTPDQWPPRDLPDRPLVILANHPFGIGDGIAILSLAEQLDRPFRVMLAADLLKVPEIRAYSLSVDFSETKEAVKNNLAMRNEALRLLKQGVTIVVFPAGGVATAPNVFGRAEDLPWKIFAARLIQEARAAVLPVHFSGQNGRLFHLVSRAMNLTERDNRLAKIIGKLSLTLRLSLLIREFTRLSGKSIETRIGRLLDWDELAPLRDRKALLQRLHRGVFELSPEGRTARPRDHAEHCDLPGGTVA